MVGDTELATLRQLYYNLLVRLFWKEPDPEFVLSLKEGLDERARAAGQLNARMGEGWQTIGAFLDKSEPAQAAEEYTTVFVGPYGIEVNPYESFYLVGGYFKEPLVEVRDFMRRVGLKKNDEDYTDPEDSLAFELEIMNWLIRKQREAKSKKGEQRWLDAQAEFLKGHLLVWGPAVAGDIEKAGGAAFYRGVGALLAGLLEMDQIHFHGIGPEHIETLEEARKRHGSKGFWKGPTYDPENFSEPTGELES